MAARSQATIKGQAWKNLAAHYKTIRSEHLRQLFADDPKRGERFTENRLGKLRG